MFPKRQQYKQTEEKLGNPKNQMTILNKGESENNQPSFMKASAMNSTAVANFFEKTFLNSGFYRFKCKTCSYINDAKDTNTIRDHIRRNHLLNAPLYSCSRCNKKYK